MAMTNRERQTKWREGLKAKAAVSQSFEEALRAKMREMRPSNWAEYGFEQEDKDIAQAAADAMLAMTDKELSEWFFECTYLSDRCLHDKCCEKIAKERADEAKAAKKAEAAAKRRTGKTLTAVTNA